MKSIMLERWSEPSINSLLEVWNRVILHGYHSFIFIIIIIIAYIAISNLYSTSSKEAPHQRCSQPNNGTMIEENNLQSLPDNRRRETEELLLRLVIALSAKSSPLWIVILLLSLMSGMLFVPPDLICLERGGGSSCSSRHKCVCLEKPDGRWFLVVHGKVFVGCQLATKHGNRFPWSSLF